MEFEVLQDRLIRTGIVLIGLTLVRWGIMRVVGSHVESARTLYTWRKATTYMVMAMATLALGQIWSEGISSISTFLGLATAGIAIALQVPIGNLAGWAFILWRRPFKVGDRIEIGPHKGDVVDTRLFEFSLLEIGHWVDADQSTGRIVHVPNGMLFREPIANFTAGMKFIWDEIGVLVTFESDWQKAKDILDGIVEEKTKKYQEPASKELKKAAQQFMIFYTKLTPIVYTSVKDHGVMLTMRFLVDPRQRRATRRAIWESVLLDFAKYPNIDFAYPTNRLFNNRLEGKNADPDVEASVEHPIPDSQR